MNFREAAQQALEALRLSEPKARPGDDDYVERGWKEHNDAIYALRAALAKPEREPLKDCGEAGHSEGRCGNASCTVPPKREPLTDAEIGAVAADIWGSILIAPQSYQQFARAIERAHGIGGKE